MEPLFATKTKEEGVDGFLGSPLGQGFFCYSLAPEGNFCPEQRQIPALWGQKVRAEIRRGFAGEKGFRWAFFETGSSDLPRIAGGATAEPPDPKRGRGGAASPFTQRRCNFKRL